MNVNETKDPIDASCRVPLLALFGGAALWLVVGSLLALVASIEFHAPAFLAGCSFLTYGHTQSAANDALLYGFCIPAGLGVAIWIFARLGQAPLRGGIVPVAAAHLWNLGVFIGMVAIFIGDSTGFAWLEFTRSSAALLFFSYLLIALWATMNFSARRDGELFPAHWFLVAALFWFPWIYSTANLLLIVSPVRGVVQAIIGWWFANNLVFVWTSLVGLGTAFYFLPKFSARPLQTYYYALFAFWTLLLFGSHRGIPSGAPVPAWLPMLSQLSSLLLIVPVLAIAVIGWKTVCGGAKPGCKGGPFCMIKFGFVSFVLSGLMLVASSCPQFSRLTEFTVFNTAQTQLQLFGFFVITMFGAIYYILPRAVGIEFSFPKLIRVQHWFAMAGVVLVVASLAIGGIEQGLKLQNPDNSMVQVMKTLLPFLHASTTGFLFMLIASLLFALNVFAMLFLWHKSVVKAVFAAIVAPLEKSEVKA
jgi:cytochrome c oxidase cbb3-type subunit 1